MAEIAVRALSGSASGALSGSANRALRRRRRVAAGRTTPEFVSLAVVVAALTGLGLLMTFSASFVQSTADTGDPFGIFVRQLLWCAIGVPAMLLAAATDYRHLRRLALPLLLAALAASALVLVIGEEVNGARRWFDFGPISFQPSELVKLAVPIYGAHVVATRWRRIRAGDLRALLVPILPATLLAAGLVLAGPDLETAVIIGVVGGIVLFVAGLPTRILVVFGGFVGVIGAAAIATTPYRRARLAAWLDPTAFSDTFGYQTVQGFIALGSGGWFGVGLGQSRGKWLYVPNAHTDFIFAIVGEELGLVGALAVLALFGGIAIAGTRAARRAPDAFGRLLAASLTGWLLLQAAVNIGSVVGLLPVTGVTLPLVSFGGSSLAFTMVGLGILLSIARAARGAGEHGPARASAGAEEEDEW